MKKRILFVDDEPMVLKVLERMMRTVCEEWDSVFVSSGPAALQELEHTQFDAVVSDMRMPVMDGAELLSAVMARQPRTVRFILSGFADRGLVCRCVGTTHQFLSKPCELETLRSTLRRALSLQTTLRSEALQTAVARIRALPVLPSLYSDILEHLRDPQCGTDEIAVLVGRDPALSLKILKLVNSAFFGFGRDISDLREAVNYLGIETLKSLALSFRVFEQFEHDAVPLAFVERLWRHSITTAAAARQIAALEDAPGRVQDEAFAAGLLHDLGKLILAGNDPAACAEVDTDARARGIPIWQAETDRFGVSHAEMGAYLLGLWGLPPTVVEAVALHHSPIRSASPEFSALTAVHAANLRPDAIALSTSSTPSTADRVYLTAIGCEGRLAQWHDLAPSPETDPQDLEVPPIASR